MNGRMLWWQDGYDQFEKVDLCRHYQEAAAPAAAFVRGVDWTGFMPIPCVFSDGVKGAVIGNDRECLGWFRDTGCEPPDWPIKRISGQTVTMDAPGDSWQLEFFDPLTGKAIGKGQLAVQNRSVRIVLPEFHGSVAVRLKQREPRRR